MSSTIEKAIDLLFHLSEAEGAQGVTVLARNTGQPKANVFRQLNALSKRELVEQDESGRYQLGFGLAALGRRVMEREPICAAVRPELERLAEETGETAFLVVARAGRLTIAAKVEGSGFIRATPRVGATMPTHATAVGKLYLAFAPDQVATAEDHLEPFTPATITTEAALKRELQRVRKRGWAMNDGEWLRGLSVAAAPIRNSTALLGGIVLATTTPRMEELGAKRIGERLVAGATAALKRLKDGNAEWK